MFISTAASIEIFERRVSVREDSAYGCVTQQGVVVVVAGVDCPGPRDSGAFCHSSLSDRHFPARAQRI